MYFFCGYVMAQGRGWRLWVHIPCVTSLPSLPNYDPWPSVYHLQMLPMVISLPLWGGQLMRLLPFECPRWIDGIRFLNILIMFQWSLDTMAEFPAPSQGGDFLRFSENCWDFLRTAEIYWEMLRFPENCWHCMEFSGSCRTKVILRPALTILPWWGWKILPL